MSSASLPLPKVVSPYRPAHTPALTVALALIAAGAVLLAAIVSGRQATLFLVGVFAGVALYHAAFGFTSSWRDFIAHRRGAGLRAQMLMLALTTAVFVPLIARGQLWGLPVRGSVAPAGVPVLVGAFIFGIGMQLGGGCASGTLFSAGGGSVRMYATLAAFIVGSVLGVRYSGFWDSAPALRPMSLVGELGAPWAFIVSLALFALVAGLTLKLERRAFGSTRSADVTPAAEATGAGTTGTGGTPIAGVSPALPMFRGPWSLVAGGCALAAVNIATLLLAGRPWGVTSAFGLWGSKLLSLFGVDVATWSYWQPAARAAELQASVFRDVTSVMDVGIMIGALAAAAAAGRFAPNWRVPARSLLAAIVGGVMLGYGARIAFGCNIGAYFSGVASTSLHGWLWLASAFTGNIVGTRLRPWFGLGV